MAAGLKTIIALSFVLAIGFLLVILSSALYQNYLPLLVVATYVIAPLPNWICGRCANPDDFMESAGNAVVDFGRFCTGFLVVMGIDVRLFKNREQLQPCFPTSPNLHFLSLVHVASIPLCLATGPSLNVYTDNHATEEWFVESLFPEQDGEEGLQYAVEPWWLRANGQSDQGILLRFNNAESKPTDKEWNITELLLYAAVSPQLGTDPPSIKPPASSSPDLGSNVAITPRIDVVRDVRMYALPLSSQRFPVAEQSTLPLVNGLSLGDAYFLGPSIDHEAFDSTSPRKRQKMISLFADAAQQRKRFRRRGGEGVSKAMAGLDRRSPSHDIPSTTGIEEELQLANPKKGTSQTRQTPRTGLSRVSSTLSTQSTELPRPPSRREAFVNGKRSSLHRVESLSSPRSSSILEPDSSIEQQNKTALTRIVMAGMRIHGLQQKQKSNKSQGSYEMASDGLAMPVPNSLPECEEEYKLVYHQTFKAASFTFRSYIACTVITPEVMREVVDRLLAIFCTEPLEKHGSGGGLQAELSDCNKTANSFDLPSAAAILAEFEITPTTSSTKRFPSNSVNKVDLD